MDKPTICLQKAQPKPFALFISDLHLQPEMPATTAAFLTFLKKHAIQAERLYLLGDIFEYWAGDDDLASPFPQQIAQALRQVSDASVETYWIAGNRDFLVGKKFAETSGITLLADPHIFEYNGANKTTRYLLTHGDLLCTDDIAYQCFRAETRHLDWQSAFLARPLHDRKSIIAMMRKQSRLHQQEHLQHWESIMDVNQEAVANLFASSQVQVIIHGHTHRPALHQHGENRRYVLSDWDQDKYDSSRGDWLTLSENGDMLRSSLSRNVK
ncbi:MAG: lpxH [Solimicrobium sp.]|nr:lpxH [Solimicrobium sp.]